MPSVPSSSAQTSLEIDKVPETDRRIDHPSRKALESKAVQATLWTITAYGTAMALRTVNSMVLTRLLKPEIFGLMTLASTMILGISLLSDIGLNPSVIQNPRGDSPDFLNTVWTLQVIQNSAIFVVLLSLAWPMAHFYHDQRVCTLVMALSFTVFINGFYSSNLLSLSRHMGVRRLFVLDICGQLVSLLVTITWALLVGRTIWALVAGSFSSVAFRLAASYFRPLVPGIRNRFQLDKESVRSVLHFGKWILMGTAASFFASQSDRLILGKLVSLSLLGVYGIAYSISDIPRSIISAFAQKVGYPFIAKMTHLPVQEFRILFLRYRIRVLAVGAFLLSLMIYLGGFLVTKMYDSRYHAASWMIPILALGLWHTLMYSTTQPALYCRGKSNYQAIGNVFYCITSVVCISSGFHFWGMFGAVVAVAASDLPMYFVIAGAASRQSISTWRQDLLATAIFVIFLGIGFAIRASVLG